MFYYNKFKEEQGWDYNISKIIRKYNDIKYHNFMNWIKKGKIPTYTPLQGPSGQPIIS